MSEERTNNKSLLNFLNGVVEYLPQKMYSLIMQWSLRSSRNTSQTSEEHSTNSKGMLQRGSIDTGILAVLNNVKTWRVSICVKRTKSSLLHASGVNSNLDNDPNAILRTVYDNLYDSLKPQSIPQAVLIIGKYQFQSAFVADQEINLLAALTEIMVECEFK